MPREFWFPDHGYEAWIPTAVPVEDPWRSWSLRGIGRRAAEAPLQSVQNEIDTIVDGFAEHLPFGGGWRFRVTSWVNKTVGDVRSSLLFLLGAVGLVLAVCCLNIANLYLGRVRDRRPELAVRTALGAGLPTRGVQMLDSSVRVEGQPEALPLNVGIDVVTPGFFPAMGIPLLAGRFFDESDRMGAPLVTIVNESIARRFFPGGDAVGRKIMSSDDKTWMTIVGVVGDVKQYGLDKETPLLRYHPWSQEPQAKAHVVIRSTLSRACRLDPVEALRYE